ncbi:MAG: hypothetical protein SFW66_10785 [Gammaproteobacteria bacterium]|nr:hypothetical protein [Gammaproteobacteria bacterium]
MTIVPAESKEEQSNHLNQLILDLCKFKEETVLNKLTMLLGKIDALSPFFNDSSNEKVLKKILSDFNSPKKDARIQGYIILKHLPNWAAQLPASEQNNIAKTLLELFTDPEKFVRECAMELISNHPEWLKSFSEQDIIDKVMKLTFQAIKSSDKHDSKPHGLLANLMTLYFSVLSEKQLTIILENAANAGWTDNNLSAYQRMLDIFVDHYDELPENHQIKLVSTLLKHNDRFIPGRTTGSLIKLLQKMPANKADALFNKWIQQSDKEPIIKMDHLFYSVLTEKQKMKYLNEQDLLISKDFIDQLKFSFISDGSKNRVSQSCAREILSLHVDELSEKQLKDLYHDLIDDFNNGGYKGDVPGKALGRIFKKLSGDKKAFVVDLLVNGLLDDKLWVRKKIGAMAGLSKMIQDPSLEKSKRENLCNIALETVNDYNAEGDLRKEAILLIADNAKELSPKVTPTSRPPLEIFLRDASPLF